MITKLYLIIRSVFVTCVASILCLSLSSCATISEIQNSQLSKTVGSFQLNPVQPNCYWYDGTSYEYNAYEIAITSQPGRAHIVWNGKFIGDTPFIYIFTGNLDRDERIVIQATPFDENEKPQEAVLKIRQELPRKIAFDLNQK